MLEENPKGYGGFVLLFYGNEAFGDGIQGLEQAGMMFGGHCGDMWTVARGNCLSLRKRAMWIMETLESWPHS